MKSTIVIVMIALLVLSGCKETLSANQKICAIAPMTGDYAIVGQEFQRGFNLAIAELNKRPEQFSLILEDDSYDKTRTVTAGTKLIEVDGCKVVIVPFLESAAPLLPVAQRNDVPLLVMFDQNQNVNDEPLLYSIGYSVEKSGQTMASYARSQEMKTAVIVKDPVEYTEQISKAFAEEFEKQGGEVVSSFALVEGEDFRTILTKIKTQQPDVVYFAMTLNPQDEFLRSVKELGVDAKMLTIDSFTDEFIAAAGEAANGVCKTDVPMPSGAGVDKLSAEYKASFGEDVVIFPFVMLGNDAAKVAALAISGKGTTSDELSQLTFTSASGETVQPKSETGRTETVYCIENGVAVPV